MSLIIEWNAHVDYLIGKVRKMLDGIRKNINMYTTGDIYKSFVLSILDNCDTVCSCCGRVELISCRGAQHDSV